jgi:hypothetical protein
MGMTRYWISIGVMVLTLVAMLGINLIRRRDRGDG